jgi:hypothetical protein
MTQSFEWNSNTTRAILAGATAITAFIAYSTLVSGNPIRQLPRAEITSLSQYIYDPTQRDNDGKQYPKLEQSRFVGSAAVVVNDAVLAHQILLGQDRYKSGHAYGRSPTIADFHTVLLGGKYGHGQLITFSDTRIVYDYQERKLTRVFLRRKYSKCYWRRLAYST